MTAREKCEHLVLGFFDGDWQKTYFWFTTNNPLLGQTPPTCFAEWKGYPRLLKFIKNRLNENKAPAKVKHNKSRSE